MRTQIQDHLNAGSKNALIFIAAMIVGVIELRAHTPVFRRESSGQ